MTGHLTPDRLADQQTPGQLALRGDIVVYTLRRIVDGLERIELWTVPYAGGAARPLTRGPARDTCPRIDPAGSRVAFLRSADDGAAQVHVVDIGGGAPRAVTDFPHGAVDLAWAPDGGALIVLADDDGDGGDGDPGAADSAPRRVVRTRGLPPGAAPTAIRLSTIDWRADGDGDGGLRLRPRHLHRVPLGGGTPERLTAGPWSAARPRVDARGRIFFLADPGADADLHPSPQVHLIDPREGTGAIRRVTDVPGGVVRFHLAGGAVRVLGYPSAGRPDAEPARWYEIEGGRSTPLGAGAAGVDGAGDGSWTGLLGDETDLHEWGLELDDDAEVSTVSRDGSTRPADLVTGETHGAPGTVSGAVAADGRRRVAVLARAGGAGVAGGGWAPDVYALDPAGPRRLTGHGAWWADVAAPVAERVEVDGPAGPITTFLLHPPSGIPCKATVLDIHGGPTGQWSAVPPLEAVLLASAGYRVAMPNIRGSIDRGPRWVAALGGAWGEADVADVLAVRDALIDRGLATRGRVGVLGLSYGGFLTQYLVGVTDSFFAAVAENGVANQVSAWGGSDLGPPYHVSAGLPDPLTDDGARALWCRSPLRNAASIRTPLLLLQGGDDRTCPASDNEQLFVALRTLHRPVEYVIYPQESHLMQATARLDRRVDRHRRVIAWFDTHLTTEETP